VRRNKPKHVAAKISLLKEIQKSCCHVYYCKLHANFIATTGCIS